jgi:hypothetical protein
MEKVKPPIKSPSMEGLKTVLRIGSIAIVPALIEILILIATMSDTRPSWFIPVAAILIYLDKKNHEQNKLDGGHRLEVPF